MVEKIFVTKPSMPSLDEYISEIEEIWDSHWLTNMGVKHKNFSKELSAYLGIDVPELVLFTNGHSALELSLQALELEGEVITTPFTFASTTHAIVRNGLEPVFCDIKADDYTIDESQIESLITEKTCAIMPVHVYGNRCNTEVIDDIAKKYRLKVIYDAAHTFGVRYRGKSLAKCGDISCYSFHATKVFNSIEGGAAWVKDKKLGAKLQRLTNFGICDEDTVDVVGVNAKLNEFCAAMGLCNLRHIDDEIAKRKQVCDYYLEQLGGIDGLKLNITQKDVESNYAYFPIMIDEKKFGVSRDDVYERLRQNGIFARKYFYPLTSSLDCYNGRFDVYNVPVADYVSKRILTLPLYADLSFSDVKRICDCVRSEKKLVNRLLNP